MPNLLILLVFMVVILASLLLLLFRFFDETRKGFYKKAEILTFQERKYYNFLSRTLRDKYNVFPQVRLANIVTIPDNYLIWEKFQPIGAKCVDFVICNKVTGETNLVIELDDKTHNLPNRKKRDAFVDRVLSNADIPILHQPLQKEYSPNELLKTVQLKIGD